MKLLQLATAFAVITMLAGCAQNVTKYDYTALREAKPRSILIIPVVNKTTQVEAADTFLATLATPIAELGYYVFPINMVEASMEDDGLSDADMVAAAPTARLANLFGADAVLYAEVNHWEASYAVINTTTTVSVHYVLKSGITGATLWDNNVTNNLLTPCQQRQHIRRFDRRRDYRRSGAGSSELYSGRYTDQWHCLQRCE